MQIFQKCSEYIYTQIQFEKFLNDDAEFTFNISVDELNKDFSDSEMMSPFMVGLKRALGQNDGTPERF